MDEKFLQPYNAAETELRIYEAWEKSGYFNPDNLPGERSEPFSIVLPPPNVTGTLHMGHAAMLAIEDILVRHARMSGKKALWVPGTDSAAIATQSKVENEIYKKEKKTRHDLGREELMKRIDAFTEESKSTIINQVKRMGSSLDWSRYAYTMDEKRYRAVMEAFVRMYEAGLIYRGNRIVNWDPKLQTTVSDEEIEYVEQKDPFYYFQYGPFVIGTVRPETKFGDKYVVMHPEDERYKDYAHGQQIELEWINGPITATVIKDEAADRETGSGVMTITPAHSQIDFDIAKRHDLDIEPVIDERGILLPIAGEFAGQHIKKARQNIVEKLRSKNLLVKTDEGYVHNVATNSRGGGIIEPQIKKQWWVAMDKPAQFPTGETMTLKEWLKKAVEAGAVSIMPDRFSKVYDHWVGNLHDWCISRQIWFGHRIPVWYRGEETYCGLEAPAGDGWEQDPDVLDTWFSSGLWTFSTLGWPEKTRDLATFHPTSVLETGYDILFFWVVRMLLMSGFLTGEIPFKQVYLHGLVRDGQGRKMSKSLGNIIDPLDMIEKFGADATRLSLVFGNTPGTDLKLSEDRVRGFKNFANKLWNISRFVLENFEEESLQADLSETDAAFMAKAQELVTRVNEHFKTLRLDLAADETYHFVWDVFAAEEIEATKTMLRNPETAEPEKKSGQRKLYETLLLSLKLLHPLMPFVTEEIWQSLPKKDADFLMVAKWPEAQSS